MKHQFLFSITALAFIILSMPFIILAQTSPNVQLTFDGNDQNETAIAIDPLNPLRLVATWNSFSSSINYLPPGYSFSTDGGVSWSTPSAVRLPQGYGVTYVGGFDPSCAFDRYGNGYLCWVASRDYYTGLGGGIFVSRTSDLGQSWNETLVGTYTGYQDKPYIAIDNTGGAKDGRVYVAWVDDPNGWLDEPEGNDAIRFAYSNDHGATFILSTTNPIDKKGGQQQGVSAAPRPITASQPQPSSSFVQGPIPAVAPNGDVYIVWLEASQGDIGTGKIKFRKSTDGGVSFDPTVIAVDNFTSVWERVLAVYDQPWPNNLGRHRISSFPTIAVDQNTGYIYIAYTHWHYNPSSVYSVSYVYSTNGGDSWSTPAIATDNANASEQFFPWLSVDRSGRVYLTFCDTRNDPDWVNSPLLVDTYLAESVNNGLSFTTPSLRISSTSYDATKGTWLSDYQGITSVDGTVLPVWTDFRNIDENVYSARVNVALTSNSANVLAGNNQRKIARQSDGTNHMVYESNGEIWYARRTSTDTDWNHFTRLSNGLLDGTKTSPSIAERDGKIFVVWQKSTGSSHDISFHKSTNGGTTWPGSNRKVLATNVGANPPLPVVVSPAANQLMVVYRTTNNLSYRTSTDYGSTWEVVTAVPSTGIYAAYQSIAVSTSEGSTRTAMVNTNTSGNGTLYYRYYIHDPDSTGWVTSLKNLSQIVPSSYTGHQNPSLTASGTPGDQTLHVAWEATYTGGLYRLIHRKSTDWYTWPNNYTVFQSNTSLRQPSIAGLSAGNAYLLFQDMVNQNEPDIYKVNYNGGWRLLLFASTGTNPSVSVGNTTAKYVWTSGSTAPYEIKTSSETLSKTGAGPLAMVYHRSVAIIDTTTNAWFEVRLDKLSVKTRRGEEFAMPFVNAQNDSLTLTPAQAFTNLASSPVALPADAESLAVVCQVNGQGLSAIKNAAKPIVIEIVFTGKNGATLRVPIINTSADGLAETKISSARGIAAFAGSEVSLRTEVAGIGKKSSLIASLGHIYEIVDTPLPKALENMAETATPQAFFLKAYPNPFNPSTQIRFAMKDAGLATLRIYNLNGQLVRELLNEYRAAGEHAIPWDGRDDRGITAASGVYFIRFEAGNEMKISKVMLVR